MTFPDTTFTTGTTITSEWLNAVNDVCENNQGVVNVKAFGAVGDGVADDTAAIQAAIDACQTAGGGTVYLPSGIYKVTQIALKPTVDILGDGITATIISGVGSVDTIITNGKLFEQSFTDFTVTHENNTLGSGIKLIHLLDGANGCKFDLLLRGLAGVSNGGFWLRGKNPNTGIANNNQYNNVIRLRVLAATTEITGSAIYFYGESIANARCNTNTIMNGSVITSWSQGLIIKGGLNRVFGLQMNPLSDFGIKIISDTAAESIYNAFYTIGFDGTWSGDLVVTEVNYDDSINLGNFINTVITSRNIINTGTYATRASIGMFGKECTLPYGTGSVLNLDATFSGGICRPQDDTYLVIQGGKNALNSKFILAGVDAPGAQSVTVGGASVMLPDTVSSEFRIVSTSNGTSGTQVIAITKDGVVRWGVNGPTIREGAGSPEGVVTAPVGSLYLRSDGGAGTTLYVKQSGTGNTGWVGK